MGDFCGVVAVLITTIIMLVIACTQETKNNKDL
jgi:hypothetical protein